MNSEIFCEAMNAEADRQQALRGRSFSDTLNWIAPFLLPCGITRLTSVTGLDNLGIPTFCSVRPGGLILQVSSGKGLTADAAKASAAMEAIELFHAEAPDPEKLRMSSANELAAEFGRASVLYPAQLPRCRDNYFSPDYVTEWTSGTDMSTGTDVWSPSGAVYLFRRPVTHDVHTNGIASGNTLAEARLHSLYELIERDAMARLYEDGVLKIGARAKVIDTSTVKEPVLRALLDRCRACDTKVLLLSLPRPIRVHAIWAVFMGEVAVAEVSRFSIGSGCHVDPVVAATRAITEAAQARLAFIHGGRDAVVRRPVSQARDVRQSNAYRFFDGLTPNLAWEDVTACQSVAASMDPAVMCTRLAGALQDAGLGPLFSFDLTKKGFGVPVARILAPNLGFRPALH